MVTKCNVCGSTFPNSAKLVEHIKRKHSRLSKESIQYLRDIGIDEEKIKKFFE